MFGKVHNKQQLFSHHKNNPFLPMRTETKNISKGEQARKQQKHK